MFRPEHSSAALPASASSTSTLLNPLLAPWPNSLPPFASVRAEHFSPAFTSAMAAHQAELDAIASQTEPPSFDNVALALDRAGRPLEAVESVLSHLCDSASTEALQAVEREWAAPLAAHESACLRHAGVFARLDTLFQQRQNLGLNPQQQRLIERLHYDRVKAGAQLGPQQQARCAELAEELARCHTEFSQNLMAEEGAYVLPLRSEEELAGLPGFLRAAARQAARDRGLADDVFAITLSRSLVEPFLTFSTRRDLRETAWRAWLSRGENPGPYDNRALVQRILKLRRELAGLHGYACFADYALADTMAGRRSAVEGLLNEVWPRALKAAAREQAAIEAQLASEGFSGPLMPWDWRYGSEKVRQARYALDDAALKPYFQLDRLVEALFDVAGRLFGLQFQARPDLHGYHPDVVVWQLSDAQGQPAGLFLHDNFARQGKRSGAWMSALALRSRSRQVDLPVVVNNNNFARGAAGEPTLLSFDDARTLFHEFGHALHGLLSQVDYHRLAGTQVLRDFVELPSQLFEHWLSEPEVLQRHARHWQTNEPIPAELIQRLQEAERWGQGHDTIAYCASTLVDQAIHALEGEPPDDLAAFEASTLSRLGMPPAIAMRHRLTHFQHLFAGSSYASAYYVYLWAEVLEADAFMAFREAGSAFDPETAARLRQHIYASGNSRPPQEAYVAFRGRMPDVGPLLRQRGLEEAQALA